MRAARKLIKNKNRESKKLATTEIIRLRSEIAALDRDFLRQFKKYLIERSKTSHRIGRIKLRHKIQIRDARVEMGVIARFERALHGRIRSKAVTTVASAIVAQSRKIQKSVTL